MYSAAAVRVHSIEYYYRYCVLVLLHCSAAVRCTAVCTAAAVYSRCVYCSYTLSAVYCTIVLCTVYSVATVCTAAVLYCIT